MSELNALDLDPVFLSLKLASVVTVLLILIATPIAWFSANTDRNAKALITTLSTLPLVLPPSVLGFYMLLLLGADGPIAALSGVTSLAFSFNGLVIASLVYSFPFAIQPLQNAFESIDKRVLESAATLGANKFDRFISIVLPLSKPGYITASILCFAHTIGEFGVILMIGGNIPGETRVLSIAIYDHVESLQYAQAHILSAGLLVFSFCVLFTLYLVNGRKTGSRGIL